LMGMVAFGMVALAEKLVLPDERRADG